jgi:hypothetical protein
MRGIIMTEILRNPQNLILGMRTLRLRLGASVIGKVQAEFDGLSAHYGEDYEFTDIPEAVIYHKIGGTFRFLAFACSPWRMWDFHVGVVALDSNMLSIGVHISERADPFLRDYLTSIAARLGTSVVHAPRAVEYQANLRPLDVTQIPFEEIESQIVSLCRALPLVAATAECPVAMQDRQVVI